VTRKRNRKNAAHFSEATSTVEPLTEDDLLRRGEDAARLLNEPIYNIAHENVYHDYLMQIVQTLPHETQKREFLYTKIQALSDVAIDLAAMVQASQGINMDAMKKEQINPTFQ